MWTDDDVVAQGEVELYEVDTLDRLEGKEGAKSAAAFSVLTSQESNELTIGSYILDTVLLQDFTGALMVHAGHQVQHLLVH